MLCPPMLQIDTNAVVILTASHVAVSCDMMGFNEVAHSCNALQWRYCMWLRTQQLYFISSFLNFLFCLIMNCRAGTVISETWEDGQALKDLNAQLVCPISFLLLRLFIFFNFCTGDYYLLRSIYQIQLGFIARFIDLFWSRNYCNTILGFWFFPCLLWSISFKLIVSDWTLHSSIKLSEDIFMFHLWIGEVACLSFAYLR